MTKSATNPQDWQAEHMDRLYDAAQTYLDLGWSFFPLGMNRKPLIKWTRFQFKPTTPDEVEDWFTNGVLTESGQRIMQFNLGLATGALSGVVVVDCDNAEAIAEANRLGLTTPFSVQTTRGQHFYWAHPRDGKEFSNHAGGNPGQALDWPHCPGLDFRGDGGFVVLPPSRAIKEDGHYIYAWDTALELDELSADIEGYRWRQRYFPRDARELTPQEVERMLSTQQLPFTLAGVRPQTGKRPSIEEELDGQMLNDGDGRNHALTRFVGEKVSDGIHGDALIQEVDRFMTKCFAEALPQKEVEATIRSVTARDRRKHPDRYDAAGYFEQPASEMGRHAMPAHEGLEAERTAKTDEGQNGPNMCILSDNRLPPPMFPAHVLGLARPWVETVAETTGPTPIDYAATSLLTTVAALIGNSRTVSPWQGWEEPSILWAALVGDPSAGKSPSMAPLRGILADIEHDLSNGHQLATRQWEADKLCAEKVREAWVKDCDKAAKNGTPPPPLPVGAIVPDEPKRHRLSVGDATVEALASILAGQPRGLLSFHDELAGLLTAFGRYTGNGGADRAFWLEAYGGRAFNIDRVKNNGKPVSIPRLSLSVLGGIQPERLRDLLLSGSSDGLAQRFLLAFPDTLAPARPRTRRDDHAAKNALRRIAELPMGQSSEGRPAPKPLMLNDASVTVFEAWRQECFSLSGLVGDRMSEFLGKLNGVSLRLALAIEHVWWAWGRDPNAPSEVTEGAMEAAVDLLRDYFIPMAERCYGDAAVSEDDRRAQTLARWIISNKLKSFTVRQVYREAHLPGLNSAEVARRAIQKLVEANWVAKLDRKEQDARGRPPEAFEVNPQIFET